MDLPEPIRAFLHRLEMTDGYAPLSDAKLVAMGSADRYVTVDEDGSIVAVGAAADHRQPSGESRWSVETATDPSMRFAEFEEVVLTEALSLVPRGSRPTVWSRRASLDTALGRKGFTPHRSLAYMEVALPIGLSSEIATVPMVAGDEGTLLAINAAAFAGHPEAASLDHDELGQLMDEDWFDREGVRFHESEAGVVDAFCWTRVHPGGVGEIYRIGVGPQARGQGLGRAMVIAGFDYLAQRCGCRRGMLWVDEANEAAMATYTSLGMVTIARNREFRRGSAG